MDVDIFLTVNYKSLKGIALKSCKQRLSRIHSLLTNFLERDPPIAINDARKLYSCDSQRKKKTFIDFTKFLSSLRLPIHRHFIRCFFKNKEGLGDEFRLLLEKQLIHFGCRYFDKTGVCGCPTIIKRKKKGRNVDNVSHSDRTLCVDNSDNCVDLGLKCSTLGSLISTNERGKPKVNTKDLESAGDENFQHIVQENVEEYSPLTAQDLDGELGSNYSPQQHGAIQEETCTSYNLMERMCFGCETGSQACDFQGCMRFGGGFLNPKDDPTQMDREIWTLGNRKILSQDIAKDIISNCRNDFLKIFKEEEDALMFYKALTCDDEAEAIWLKVDNDRRYCDRCSTSIFNRLWVCSKCMIVLCIDCHKSVQRKRPLKNIKICWLTKSHHNFNDFILAQQSPDNCLEDLKTDLDKISNIQIQQQHLNSQRSIHIFHDTNPSENIDKFKSLLKAGEPCIFQNIDFNSEITPTTLYDSFSEECPIYDVLRHREIVSDVDIQQFWAGFESYENRVRQVDGTPYVLQLKDFPQSGDLKAVNPQLFQKFMKKLPIPEYMDRDGDYNLVALFPISFKPPELGPKFYVAYAYPEIKKDLATTKLHMDISDAVNINVFVSVPPDWPKEYHEGVKKIMEDWEVDMDKVKERMKNGAIPGALWLIFHPSDCQKMNQVLSKGKKNRHPIHSQDVSITKIELQLLAKNKIFPYVYVQCQGDAVFIPAGAPHQVKNLGDCIKMAEDFVSPENLNQCLKITQEIRRLPINYENRADKLQAKAIVYHSMRVAVSSILRHQSNLKL